MQTVQGEWSLQTRMYGVQTQLALGNHEGQVPEIYRKIKVT
jgi:hypothetical protein